MCLARLALVLVGLSACGGIGADPGEAAPRVRYDEGEAGLGELMSDLVSAFDRGDRQGALRLVRSFELPGHEEWFSDAFGPELGARLAVEYEPMLGQFEQLADVLRAVVSDGKTNIAAERFDTADDPDATGFQSLALAAMKQPIVLYSVRFKGTEDAFHLWSFVHERGTFRWVGKLAAVGPPLSGEGIDRRLFRQRDAEAVVEKLGGAARPDPDPDADRAPDRKPGRSR